MKVYKAKVVITDSTAVAYAIENKLGIITAAYSAETVTLTITGEGLFRKDKTVALFNGNVACTFGAQTINTLTCILPAETTDAVINVEIEVAEDVAEPLEFKAFITQAGTDDPVIKPFKNQLGNYAAARYETGVYTLTFDEDILLADNTNASISPDTDITLAVNGDELQINCEADDVLTGSYLEITVYP